MKKTLVSYIFASTFFICAVLITDIQAKINQEKRKISSVALATGNNEIIFFKKDNSSNLIQIKMCSRGENIQKNRDCKIAKNTSEIKVSADTLKRHLMTAFAMSPQPKQGLTQKLQRYWQMKTLGEAPSNIELNMREVEKIESLLAEVCGAQYTLESACAKEHTDVQKLIQLRQRLSANKEDVEAIESINSVMEQIIDRLILTPEVHFISPNSSGFVYSILSSYIRPQQARFDFVKVKPATVEMRDLRYQGKNRVRSTSVQITEEFEIGKTEVTQFQWFAIMGFNPSFFKKPDDCPESYVEGIGTPLKSSICSDLPVENVSWKQAQTFIEKLNRQDPTYNYRLPTEAEWVLASSDNKNELHFFGADLSLLSNYAWYAANSSLKTHPVARREPNQLGLYDVYGNVAEWIQDSFDELPATAANDYVAKENDQNQFLKVVRGGHYGLDASMTNSALRFNNYSFEPMKEVGLRLVRTKK